jgi:hypothetical protein
MWIRTTSGGGKIQSRRDRGGVRALELPPASSSTADEAGQEHAGRIQNAAEARPGYAARIQRAAEMVHMYVARIRVATEAARVVSNHLAVAPEGHGSDSTPRGRGRARGQRDAGKKIHASNKPKTVIMICGIAASLDEMY